MENEKKAKRQLLQVELDAHFENALRDKHTRVEFIRRSNQKIGVMIACINPLDPDKVIIGFSLCHSRYDEFDHINFGLVKKKNIGKKIAHRRAIKYEDYAEALVYDQKLEENLDGTVYIPASVDQALVKFVYDCYKYYKDKEFPVWVESYFPKEEVDTFVMVWK
jgi:hypothetical protein